MQQRPYSGEWGGKCTDRQDIGGSSCACTEDEKVSTCADGIPAELLDSPVELEHGG